MKKYKKTNTFLTGISIFTIALIIGTVFNLLLLTIGGYYFLVPPMNPPSLAGPKGFVSSISTGVSV